MTGLDASRDFSLDLGTLSTRSRYFQLPTRTTRIQHRRTPDRRTIRPERTSRSRRGCDNLRLRQRMCYTTLYGNANECATALRRRRRPCSGMSPASPSGGVFGFSSITLAELARTYPWAGPAALRRLRAGTRTAGPGRRSHRRAEPHPSQGHRCACHSLRIRVRHRNRLGTG